MFEGRAIELIAGKSNKNKDFLLSYASRINTEKGIKLQFIDANKVFGIDHIKSAFEKAVRAFNNDENVSDSLLTEIMLYISGCRQIQEAVELIGLNDESDSIIVISESSEDSLTGITDALNIKEEKSLLSAVDKDPRTIGISEEEINTVPEDKIMDLVLERVAGVDIKKK